MKPDIYKIELIGSGFLAVMAKPVSGEWIEEEFKGIAAERVNKIVSLLENHELYELGLQREASFANKNGMEFISFPIKDRGLPKSIVEFSTFTKNLYSDIVSGKNTVIHCRAGIGRTGIVAASVLLHSGFDPDEAFKYLSAKRGVQMPDTDEQYHWVLSNSREITGNI